MWILWVSASEAVVIVTGNVAVLVVFTRTPVLRKRKHYLLVSLAVADLLVGVISVPMYAVLVAGYSDPLRMIYNIQDPLLGSASVFGLTAVAIERAYAVYFPFKHRTLWKGVYMIGIAVIWILAFIFAISVFYSKTLITVLIVAVIITSLVIVTLSYTMIWIKMHCMTPLSISHAIPGRDKKLTVTLLIVTMISLFAWIPLLLINAMLSFGGSQSLGLENIVLVTKFCHYGNSLVNPIVYALRMPGFKTALRTSFSCCNSFANIAVFAHESREGNNGIDRKTIENNNEQNNHHGNTNHYDNKDYCHGNESTYHTSAIIHFPASSSNNACGCSESTNEIKPLAVDNEGFIDHHEETKL